MIQSMESFDILMNELNEYFIEDEISKRYRRDSYV